MFNFTHPHPNVCLADLEIDDGVVYRAFTHAADGESCATCCMIVAPSIVERTTLTSYQSGGKSISSDFVLE